MPESDPSQSTLSPPAVELAWLVIAMLYAWSTLVLLVLAVGATVPAPGPDAAVTAQIDMTGLLTFGINGIMPQLM
jgi:hypothetical protein